MKPNIVITMGDPAGIGPEIVSKCFATRRIQEMCNIIVLETTSKSAGKRLTSSGRTVLAAIRKGVQLCMSGEADALVTAPVSKKACSKIDRSFVGHTEMLAEISGARMPVMMMQARACKIVMMTRHTALKDIGRNISVQSLCSVVETTYKDLIKTYHMQIHNAVMSALNPHAGESGNIGQEEKRIIIPALLFLRKKGYAITGPEPADVCMRKLLNGDYDLGFGMYHDQVMIPLKLKYPWETVNVTLGLPFIRTSPAHGVAYDIAGKNCANPRSMEEAIRVAVEMVKLKKAWR
ncbi:MAG: 4-hydroxythreonine-4-phosphate dehydrogenase PdxA [bacterium]